MPARNPDQVKRETALRLQEARSVQAKELSQELLEDKIEIPQRTQPSSETIADKAWSILGHRIS
jgi:hypothetical protein